MTRIKKDIMQESQLLEELANETPEKLIFTEAGTIMQDYITAYTSQFNPSDRPSFGASPYLSSLMYAVVDRINKNTKTIN